MSTPSIQLSSNGLFPIDAFGFSPDGSPKSPTEFLIEITAIQPEDRVLVIGSALSDRLAGLVRHGCVAATGIHPDALDLHHEPADVIWLADLDGEAVGPVGALLRRIGEPRLIAVQLPAAADVERGQDFLRRLGAHGMVHGSYHRLGDLLVVVAFRPRWLRWVASGQGGRR